MKAAYTQPTVHVQLMASVFHPFIPTCFPQGKLVSSLSFPHSSHTCHTLRTRHTLCTRHTLRTHTLRTRHTLVTHSSLTHSALVTHSSHTPHSHTPHSSHTRHTLCTRHTRLLRCRSHKWQAHQSAPKTQPVMHLDQHRSGLVLVARNSLLLGALQNLHTPYGRRDLQNHSTTPL